jgi:hypothetical protein
MLCGFVLRTHAQGGAARPALRSHATHLTRAAPMTVVCAMDCARIAMRKNPITTCMPIDLRSWARLVDTEAAEGQALTKRRPERRPFDLSSLLL